MSDDLLSRAEAGPYIGVSPATLAMWWHLGKFRTAAALRPDRTKVLLPSL